MERKEFLKISTLASAGLAFLPGKTLLAAEKNTSARDVTTRHIQAGNINFAYRRFGRRSGIPLVFTNYLTGTMDNWDPAVMDGFAKEREVIIFDNAGVSSSTGQTPNTIADMAKDAATFINALGLKQVDLLGFSIGGMVAQQLTFDHPDLIRRLILIGTGPRGGERMDDYAPDVWAYFKKQYPHPDELLLDTFFTQTTKSQAAGWDYLKRIRARADKEPALTDKVVPAQLAAIFSWGKRYAGSFDYLQQIKQPTLVVHGDQDIICPTVNAVILKEHLPNADLVILPDTNHAPHYQYPALFLQQARQFLNA